MKVDLLEFMRTGIFGELRLGMRPEEVSTAIGPPEDHSPASASPQIWKVGSTELMFENDILMSIEQKLTEMTTWPTVEIAPASLARLRALKEEELLSQPRTLGISVLECRKPGYLPETTIFLLDRNVRLTFVQKQPMTLSVLAP